MADGKLTDIDPNVLELLERRISERVAENVERTLKWRYGVVLAVFTAVAALFGWSISSAVDGQVQKVVGEAKAAAEADMQALLSESEELSKETELKFALAEDVQRRVGKTMDDVDRRVGEFDAKVRVLDELGGRIDAVGQRLVDVTAQLDAATQRRVVELDDRLRPLNENLASLGEQLAELQTLTLAARPDLAIAPADPAYSKVREQTAAIVEQSNSRLEQAAKPAGAPTTVYFQFAGGSRQQAQRLSATLKQAGFQVPGEERTGGAATQHEVRYFHEDDQSTAETLARTVNMAGPTLGYALPEVVVRDFTDYPLTKPRLGTVELWLEIPPLAKAAQAAP
jgi:DNA repair exonuclease SbcCD ATPase subunit